MAMELPLLYYGNFGAAHLEIPVEQLRRLQFIA